MAFNVTFSRLRLFQDVVEARARFLNQLKRYYYVTPTSYLELINLYGTMLKEQKTKINGAKERISNGLKVHQRHFSWLSLRL